MHVGIFFSHIYICEFLYYLILVVMFSVISYLWLSCAEISCNLTGYWILCFYSIVRQYFFFFFFFLFLLLCSSTGGAVDCSGGRSTKLKMAAGQRTMGTVHIAAMHQCTVTKRPDPASNEPKPPMIRDWTWTMPQRMEEETWHWTGPARLSWCSALTRHWWRKKTPRWQGETVLF